MLPASQRYDAFRETMLRILTEAGQVASAISTDGGIVMRGVGEEIDPEAAPVLLRGFNEHLIVIEGGTSRLPFFGLVSPSEPERINPCPQFHLLDLVKRTRELNVYCQQAHSDGALAVALQSPGLPEKVDRIVALAAFFAAYFESLAVTQPHHGIVPGRSRTPIDLDQLKASYDRYRLMAVDRMVMPERLEDYLPAFDWPSFGIEILRRPETGHGSFHGIYFPTELARQLTDKLARALEPEDELETA